jgi:hypothetical protein
LQPPSTTRRAPLAYCWVGIAAISLLTVAVVSPVTSAQAMPAASPEYWTRSYYVANPSVEAITHLGCYQSDVSGRMSLFFGSPTDVDGAFGATLWGGENRNVDQIGELVMNFVRGFVWCRQGGQQILVGMGTSTSGADDKPDEWLVGHGATWSTVVRDINAWADETFPGVAAIYGAWDAEPSWSAPNKAESWMAGYASVPEARGLHTHFSADGCPRDMSDNGACNKGWNQHDVWRLAWEYDPALPAPQIYATSGVNARQWQRIDEYGARYHDDGMVFYGVMTQWGACSQRGGCVQTDNEPFMGHDQLLWTLNSTPITQQESIESATDIYWHS